MGVLRDHADRAPQRLEREIAHVDAVDQHRAVGDVVQARDQRCQRALAGARRADQRHGLAGFERERQPRQHVAVGIGAGDRLLSPSTRSTTRWPADTGTSRRRTRPGRGGSTRSTAPGRSVIGSGASSTSNTRSNDTIDVIRSTRAFVSPVSGWYTRVTSAARATSVPGDDLTVDDELGADAVDRSGADGSDEAECHEEHPSEHRRPDAGVAHRVGPIAERLVLTPLVAEQLHQHRARHVEPFGHLGVHRGVVLHLLA